MCGRIGKIWEIHGCLLTSQDTLNPEDLLKHAEAIGSEVTQSKECLGGGKHRAAIRAAVAEGQEAGISGTPTL